MWNGRELVLTVCGQAESFVVVFFFNDTATTEIYTLSLHDALPISPPRRSHVSTRRVASSSCELMHSVMGAAAATKT